MLLSSVVTALLMTSTPSKRILLMILLSLEKSNTEQDQVNWEVLPIQRCSSLQTTAGRSTYPVSLLFRLTQISSDDLLNTVLFHVHIPTAIPAQRYPSSCLLKASRSWNHHSPPPCTLLWNSCVTEKHDCTTLYYLSIMLLLKHFEC